MWKTNGTHKDQGRIQILVVLLHELLVIFLGLLMVVLIELRLVVFLNG